MRLETTRCLVAGLTDNTIGINAKITALTLEGGDSTPPPVTVYNDVQQGWLARKTFTTAAMQNVDLPGLALFVGHAIQILQPEVITVVRDGTLTFTFAYLDKKSATEIGTYNALQTERALMRFLSAFSANGNAAMRTRNGIVVEAITRIEPQPIATVKDDVFIGAATEVDFHVRETSP